jgi:hypothetical protein
VIQKESCSSIQREWRALPDEVDLVEVVEEDLDVELEEELEEERVLLVELLDALELEELEELEELLEVVELEVEDAVPGTHWK